MSLGLLETLDGEILWRGRYKQHNISRSFQVRGVQMTLGYQRKTMQIFDEERMEWDDADIMEIKVYPYVEGSSKIHESDKPTVNQNQIFMHEMQELLDSGKLSDTIIVVNDTEWHVHKAILAARSKVFAAMFKDHTKEFKENKIVIEDIDVDTMNEVLKYIYTGKVTDIYKSAYDLVAPADKYDLKHLFDICDKVLANIVSVHNIQSMLTLVNLFNLKLLKTEIFSLLTQNPELFSKKDFSNLLQKLSPVLLTQIINSIALSKIK